jgi:hypothetical protein
MGFEAHNALATLCVGAADSATPATCATSASPVRPHVAHVAGVARRCAMGGADAGHGRPYRSHETPATSFTNDTFFLSASAPTSTGRCKWTGRSVRRYEFAHSWICSGSAARGDLERTHAGMGDYR